MKKKVTVNLTSKLMGTSEQFIRVGLQRKILPIGDAVKLSTKWTYYISPKLLSDYTGIPIEKILEGGELIYEK